MPKPTTRENIETNIRKITFWNAKNTSPDHRGTPRLLTNDSDVPSPSRLMQMLSFYVHEPISRNMVLFAIKSALRNQDDHMAIINEMQLVNLPKTLNAERIDKYANMLYDKMSNNQRRDAFFFQYGKRGHRIHDLIEQSWHTGDLEPVDLSAEETVVKNKFASFQKFMYEHSDWHFFASELFVCDATRSTKGIIDGLFFDADDNLVIVDFKSNSSIEEHYVAIQLYFYKKALESWNIHTERLAILHLTEKGYYLINIDPKMFSVYEEVWKSLLNIWQYCQMLKDAKFLKQHVY